MVSNNLNLATLSLNVPPILVGSSSVELHSVTNVASVEQLVEPAPPPPVSTCTLSTRPPPQLFVSFFHKYKYKYKDKKTKTQTKSHCHQSSLHLHIEHMPTQTVLSFFRFLFRKTMKTPTLCYVCNVLFFSKLWWRSNHVIKASLEHFANAHNRNYCAMCFGDFWCFKKNSNDAHHT